MTQGWVPGCSSLLVGALWSGAAGGEKIWLDDGIPEVIGGSGWRLVPVYGRVSARPLAIVALEVGPARLERATSCSGGKRSIQLSYGP